MISGAIACLAQQHQHHHPAIKKGSENLKLFLRVCTLFTEICKLLMGQPLSDIVARYAQVHA